MQSQFIKSLSKGQTIPKEKNKSDYQKKLLTIKGDWIDPQEIIKNRKQIEKQLTRRSL